MDLVKRETLKNGYTVSLYSETYEYYVYCVYKGKTILRKAAGTNEFRAMYTFCYVIGLYDE